MLENVTKTIRYFRRGKNFCTEICCTHRKGYFDLGIQDEMAWCLYVVIGKGHPLYDEACKNKTGYDTDLGDKIYGSWHGGCTYYKKDTDFVKIGCDYQHLGDEEYYKNISEEVPEGIAADFNNLYNFFKGE